MTLTRFQISELKKLQQSEKSLAAFCDTPEGEKLLWAGLVAACAPKAGIFATVVLSDAGRAALASMAA